MVDGVPFDDHRLSVEWVSDKASKMPNGDIVYRYHLGVQIPKQHLTEVGMQMLMASLDKAAKAMMEYPPVFKDDKSG